MKVVLEIKDSKANFIIELLKNFSFVKVTPINSEKSEILSNLKEAVEELNLVKSGKIEARNVEDLINEL